MGDLRIFMFAVAFALSSIGGINVAAAQVVEGEEHCVINVKTTDALNVRAKNSAASKVVTTLRYGECGIVVTGSCKGSWCPVEDGHDAGWVKSNFISMVSPAIYCVTGVGAGDGLNVRAFPSPSSRIVTVLHRRQCDSLSCPTRLTAGRKCVPAGTRGG